LLKVRGFRVSLMRKPQTSGMRGLRYSIYLPVGSEPGEYKIQVLQCFLRPQPKLIWGTDQANYGKRLEENGNRVHEVAQKRPNGFGLYDTLGNVWEWVNDWYDENYYQHGPPQDPSGPTSGKLRVLRGGSWFFNPRDVRVSNRGGGDPDIRNNLGGVRCAREVDSP
jgi:formylglycine-generating enzyme required for sulfatase activity